MSYDLDNVLKGLVLHFLHGGTVPDAVEQGRDAGAPEKLLDALPLIMFDVTLAARFVFAGRRKLKDVLDEMSDYPTATKYERQVARKNIGRLIQVALGFMKELSGDQGTDIPLPEINEPWYEYGRTKNSRQPPGAYSSGPGGRPH